MSIRYDYSGLGQTLRATGRIWVFVTSELQSKLRISSILLLQSSLLHKSERLNPYHLRLAFQALEIFCVSELLGNRNDFYCVDRHGPNRQSPAINRQLGFHRDNL